MSLTAFLLLVTPPSTPHPPAPRSWLARYDLQHPTRVVTLPRALVEVSGLAAWDATHLLAHNDERPTLFVIRTEDGRIVREIRLGLRNRNGDYEDLALDGRHGFLAESDGSLLEFTLDDTTPAPRSPTGGSSDCRAGFARWSRWRWRCAGRGWWWPASGYAGSGRLVD